MTLISVSANWGHYKSVKQIYKLNITFVKYPNRWEANQLAIYKAWPWILKRGYRETNPSGQSGIWTRGLRSTSLAP